MPVEDMEEQGLSKIPDLGVAQLKFQLQHLKYSNPTAKQQVLELFASTVFRIGGVVTLWLPKITRE